MKTNASPIKYPILDINKKNKTQLLVISKSIEKVFPINLKERLKGLCNLLIFDFLMSEDLPREFQEYKEEIISERLKHQLPPRFF